VASHSAPLVQVLLPVHNEAESIEHTLREIDKTLAPLAAVELIVCEDGSRDGTRGILQRLAGELRLRLVLGEGRKGYTRAVIDGFRACTAPYVLSLDSDGQCDPRDFEKFLPLIGTADVIMGWRVRRQDTLARRAMSGLFRVIYRWLLGVRLRDPSCPYILFSRESVEYLLGIPSLGLLWQGFWWEVVARLRRGGFTIAEVPVNHRSRAAGRTQAYQPRKLAGIFFGYLWGCIKIRAEKAPAGAPRAR
jgi:dolichol-phosphate mannosyltransferase